MARRPTLALLTLLGALCGCPQSVSTLPDGGAPPPPPEDGGARVEADGGVIVADAGPAPDAGGSDCTPECGARQCGPDPLCGVSCGTCETGAACSVEGTCLPSCAPGAYVCGADGVSYQACGPNEVLGVWDLGPRVACAFGAACGEGRSLPCERPECVPADVLVLWDRSSRTALDSLWVRARDALVEALDARDQENRVGFLSFPDGDCRPGEVVPFAEGAAAAVAGALPPPGNEPSTPLAAALEAVEGDFRANVDGQAVLLVTAGDETCASPEATVRAAGALYRLGVRTYVVALTAQANRALLDRVAEAGGTGQARVAETPEALPAAIHDAFEDLGACANRRARVALGAYHACRLSPDGAIDCWGRDYDGRLSPPAARYRHLAAGTDNACAVTETAEVRCWGRNQRGQSVAPTGSFSEVSGGDSHFCGLRLSGEAACWGYDDVGQSTPPAGPFTQLAVGGFHSCALRPDATVTCWGNHPALSGEFSQIDAGSFATCGVHLDGSLACNGRLSPPPEGTFVQVSAGSDHACAVRTDGTVACWGANHWQQSEPPAGAFTSVAVNNDYSCGVRPDDTLECWGYGGDGQASPPP